MVEYKTVHNSPPRYQWESNSGSFFASQSNNCGPTSVTRIAEYYQDNPLLGIESTRRLVVGCCVPTTGGQQAAMLSARGVPASSVWLDSLEQIDNLIGWDGVRPIVVGIEMARVPINVRDHNFLGWHAVVILSRARVTLYNAPYKPGTVVEGYWVNDPNFSPSGGIRPDPDHGKKFYSRSVMQYAFIDNWPRWAVVPNKKKKVFVNTVAAGDPALDQVRFVNELGNKVEVMANKPFRSGISLESPVIKRFDKRHTLRLTGKVKQEDMDDASRPFGPVWFGPVYRANGKHRLMYVMNADIVDGSYGPVG